MFRAITIACLAALIMLIPAFSSAEVELSKIQTITTQQKPIDTAVSPRGDYFYILTDGGNIEIYNANGTLKDTIKVDPGFDALEVLPSGTMLLTDRDTKNVEVVNLDFVVSINTQGSPFKGPENAPVVVAVFSDFQ